MTLTLYGHPGYCSLAAHICLILSGMPYRFVAVDVHEGKTETGQDYKTIASEGAVPALQLEDGTILTQVTAIIWWICKKSKKVAYSDDLYAQSRLIEQLGQCGDLHKAMSTTLYHKAPMSIWERRLGELEARLPETGYLNGSEPGPADYYSATIVNWNNFVDKDFSQFPKCKAHLRRVWDLDVTKRALKEEGMSTELKP